MPSEPSTPSAPSLSQQFALKVARHLHACYVEKEEQIEQKLQEARRCREAKPEAKPEETSEAPEAKPEAPDMLDTPNDDPEIHQMEARLLQIKLMREQAEYVIQQASKNEVNEEQVLSNFIAMQRQMQEARAQEAKD